MTVGTICPLGPEAKLDAGVRGASERTDRIRQEDAGVSEAQPDNDAAGTAPKAKGKGAGRERASVDSEDEGFLARMTQKFQSFRRKRSPGDEEEVLKAKWSKLFPGIAPDPAGLSMIAAIDLDMRRVSTRDGATVDDLNIRIDVSKATEEAIEIMLAMVVAHDWDAVKLDGTDDFRRKAWIALQQAGIQAVGYEPTAKDMAEVSRRKAEKARDRQGPVLDLPSESVVERSPEGSVSGTDTDLAIPPPPSRAASSTAPAASQPPQPLAPRSLPFRTIAAAPLIPAQTAPAQPGPVSSAPPSSAPVPSAPASPGPVSARGEHEIGLDEVEIEGLRQDLPPDDEGADPVPAAPAEPGSADEVREEKREPAAALAGPALA